MDYIELNIDFREIRPWRDIAISQLAEMGFESFVETKTGILSYIPVNLFREEMIDELEMKDVISQTEVKVIKDQNWNAEWEKNFEPVLVDNLLAIKAPFHDQEFTQKMVVTVQPKMSFGTGHHQTTWLISRRLFDLKLTEQSVLDMGTGTGVLAILAEKLGASKVFAPDIDQWSYENAIENVALNNCEAIEVALGDDRLLEGRNFDIIIANINKNVLIQHFSVYSKSLNSGGKLLISGFFETDQYDLRDEAERHGFIFEYIFTREGWALMEFRK